MSHTREEEWKQVRALHLVRDERDREVGAAAKGRAGDAVLAASQLFAAVCLLRGGTRPGPPSCPSPSWGRGAVPSSVLGG